MAALAPDNHVPRRPTRPFERPTLNGLCGARSGKSFCSPPGASYPPPTHPRPPATLSLPAAHRAGLTTGSQQNPFSGRLSSVTSAAAPCAASRHVRPTFPTVLHPYTPRPFTLELATALSTHCIPSFRVSYGCSRAPVRSTHKVPARVPSQPCSRPAAPPEQVAHSSSSTTTPWTSWTSSTSSALAPFLPPLNFLGNSVGSLPST